MKNCIICGKEYPDENIAITHDGDGVLSCGYGTIYDNNYLYPMTNWMVEKIKSWEQIHSPSKYVPLCDTCIENLDTEGHITIRSRHDTDIRRKQYEFVESRKHIYIISFEDLIINNSKIEEDVFRYYGLETIYLSRQEIIIYHQITMTSSDEYKIHPGEYLVINDKNVYVETQKRKIFDYYHKKY